MSRNRNALCLSIALVLAAPAAFAAGENIDKINGSITAEAGQGYGDLETVNGSITLESGSSADSAETVNGSIFFDRGSRIGDGVTTVNGAIGLVETEVGGDIETVNGDITVGIGSHVGGHVKVEKPTSNWMPINLNKRKPRIVIGPNAVVDGPLIFEREVTLYVHNTARTGKITGATAVRYDGARAPQD